MKIKAYTVLASAIFVSSLHAQQYWNTNGTSAVINTANWGTLPAGPFSTAYAPNTEMIFGANSTIAYVTLTDVGNFTVNDGFNVTWTAAGTMTTGGNVRTFNVGTGSTLDMAAQNFSTAVGTGFIKSGAGTLITANGNTYPGGFTLNAGTVAAGGVNALGAGGALTINGGTIRSNGTNSRDFTGKYSSINIGGNFALGDVVNNGTLTFSNDISLGAAPLTITANSTAIFTGIISSSPGVGLIKAGSGAIVLAGGANTYDGATTINSGTLSFRTGTSDSPSLYTFGAGAAIGLGIGSGRFTDAEVVAIFAGTVPASLPTVTINAATSISLDTIGTSGVTFAGAIAPTTRGLEKISGGANLTLTGANQYSGRTVIGGTSAVLINSLGNKGDTSSNVGTNDTIDFASGSRMDYLTAFSSNKNFNLLAGTATFFGSAPLVTLSGDVSTETTGLKTFTLGGNTGSNFFSGTITNGSGQLALTKSGACTWTLSGTNTYTGNTGISGGSLVYRTLLSKTSAGTHAFAAGTTIGLGIGALGFSLTDVDNAFIGGALTGNLSNVTVTATTSVGIDTSAGDVTYATNVGGVTKGLAKFGANTLTLSGTTSAYTGATSIFGGTLSAATLANAGSSSSIGAFATAGAPGLILNGSVFSYTGSTTATNRGFTHTGTAESGISVAGSSVALTLGASTISNTANLNITGGTGSSLVLGAVSVTSAQGNFNASIPTTVGPIAFTGNNVIGNRGTLATSIVDFGSITGTGASTLFLAGSIASISTTNFNGVVGGFSGLVSIGGENLSVLGANTYTGATQIQSGSILFNSIKNVGGGASSFGEPASGNGTIQFGNGANVISLTYTGTGDTTDRVLNLRGTTGTVTLSQAGTGLLKFTSPLTATGAGSKTLVLSGSTAGTGELEGAIIDNSISNTTALIKSGSGTWTLSGINTYTGPTAINGGTLVITGSSQSTSAITFSGGGVLGLKTTTPVAAAGATIDFTGQTVNVTGTTGLPSYTLLTANSMTGVPTLAPAVPGYELQVVSNELRLVQTVASSAYATWAAVNATSGTPSTDFDGDGVSNAVEFVLGGLATTNDLSKLPVLATSGANATFTFQRAQSSIDPKTATSIEVSTDLVTWTTAPSPYTVPDGAAASSPGVTVVKNSPTAGTDTVTLTVPQAPDPKKFARLKVVITP